ncbi:hypothetical protein HNO89_004157 [Sporosarcina luteola]|nr:hypothetical protein [Sporosarcina luteola]
MIDKTGKMIGNCRQLIDKSFQVIDKNQSIDKFSKVIDNPGGLIENCGQLIDKSF